MSLVDARAGEELLLLPYRHQPARTPFRASGPIFVRRGARRTVTPAGVVPEYVTRRLVSLRAYDGAHYMAHAEVCEGPEAESAIARSLGDERIACIHLHNASRGCFLCRVDRI